MRKVLLAVAVLAAILSLSSCVDEDSSSVPASSRRPSSSIVSSYSIPNIWDDREDEVSSEEEKKSRTVYITPTGERYHFRSTCGGKNSFAIELDDAIDQGYTPCKKCARG